MWIDYGSDLLAPLAVTGDVHKERVYMLIQGVQEYIEGFCHRKFDLQEHDETGICGQDGSIILRNSPVQCITRLCFYNYGWLIIANTTAQVATFSTTHDGLNLMSIVNGVRSTFTLPYSLYPTMISLAGAINNMAGWMQRWKPALSYSLPRIWWPRPLALARARGPVEVGRVQRRSQIGKITWGASITKPMESFTACSRLHSHRAIRAPRP